MAEEIVKQTSAMGAHHEGLLSGDEGDRCAVVFNRDASVSGLLSFAHGQLSILTSMLSVMNEGAFTTDINEVADAIRSIIAPATRAIALAADRV